MFYNGQRYYKEEHVLQMAPSANRYPEVVGRAKFRLATPTYLTVAYSMYNCIIYKQIPVRITSRGVQG